MNCSFPIIPQILLRCAFSTTALHCHKSCFGSPSWAHKCRRCGDHSLASLLCVLPAGQLAAIQLFFRTHIASPSNYLHMVCESFSPSDHCLCRPNRHVSSRNVRVIRLLHRGMCYLKGLARCRPIKPLGTEAAVDPSLHLEALSPFLLRPR